MSVILIVYLFCDYQGNGPSITTEGDHDRVISMSLILQQQLLV